MRGVLDHVGLSPGDESAAGAEDGSLLGWLLGTGLFVAGIATIVAFVYFSARGMRRYGNSLACGDDLRRADDGQDRGLPQNGGDIWPGA